MPIELPPQAEAYHFHTAEGCVPRSPSVTVNVEVPPEHSAAGVAVAVVGAVESV